MTNHSGNAFIRTTNFRETEAISALSNSIKRNKIKHFICLLCQVFAVVLIIILYVQSEQKIYSQVTSDIVYDNYSQSLNTGDLVKVKVSSIECLYERIHQTLQDGKIISESKHYYCVFYGANGNNGYLYIDEKSFDSLMNKINTESIYIYGKIVDAPDINSFDSYTEIDENGEERICHLGLDDESRERLQKAIDHLKEYKIIEYNSDPVFTKTERITRENPRKTIYTVIIVLLIIGIIVLYIYKKVLKKMIEKKERELYELRYYQNEIISTKPISRDDMNQRSCRNDNLFFDFENCNNKDDTLNGSYTRCNEDDLNNSDIEMRFKNNQQWNNINYSCIDAGHSGICDICKKTVYKLYVVTASKGKNIQSKNLCNECAVKTIKQFQDLQQKNRCSEIDFINQTYNKMNPKVVTKLFYGNSEEAVKILSPLRSLLYESVSPTEEQFNETASFYTQTWIRKHGGFSPESSTTPYIKKAIKQRFSSFSYDKIDKGVNLCLDYIYEHEPSFKNKEVEMFRNVETVSSASNEYAENYKTGIEMFEQGDFSAAILAFEKCLIIKSDDTSARFEIAEAYISSANWVQAKNTLISAAPFISSNSDKARLYRRLGFIEIESPNFDLATALFVYSLKFERNEIAINELKYIISVTKEEPDIRKDTIISALKNNHLLFWDSE